MTDINHLYNLLDKDEYAKRINKNVDDWTEDDYEGAYEYEADKRDEEFSDMYESVNSTNKVNESVKTNEVREASCDETELADDSFAHDDSM